MISLLVNGLNEWLDVAANLITRTNHVRREADISCTGALCSLEFE